MNHQQGGFNDPMTICSKRVLALNYYKWTSGRSLWMGVIKSNWSVPVDYVQYCNSHIGGPAIYRETKDECHQTVRSQLRHIWNHLWGIQYPMFPTRLGQNMYCSLSSKLKQLHSLRLLQLQYLMNETWRHWRMDWIWNPFVLQSMGDTLGIGLQDRCRK